MKIHNLMEDIVKEKTMEIFSDRNLAQQSNFCNCHQCLSDVICYVLNRIKPIYIFSARGAAHFKMNYLENLQREADLVTQIYRGIEQIARARRPLCSDLENVRSVYDGPYFNFSTITGKLFNSQSFEPVDELSISLYSDGKLVDTINKNWPNPYYISSNTSGIFTFFVLPRKADDAGITKSFEFELIVNSTNYEPFRHYFALTVEAEKYYIDFYRLNRTYNIEDLYLVPINDED